MSDVKASLLIVDDDPSIRDYLYEMFACMGHFVRTAEDGFHALHEMRASLPDILLSDLNMPRMSGFELLSVVRRRFPSIYVIAMSGDNPRSDIPNGVAADGFYEKASGVVALLEAVKSGVISDRLSIWASRKATPIWVPLSKRHSPDISQVFIGCPECLRAFPYASESRHSLQETTCAHCSAPINYAVVEQYASTM
ncbi:response regulator [Acidicapsa acidisoli]|uniref:response regulator n=1 Tax=Acidicapsa acidisoli TaxID=1615681 RepID=UPI0021E09BCE|nr:response regulator [Acidicapsa acidisoli]